MSAADPAAPDGAALSLRARAFVALQYLLPKRALSAVVHAAARTKVRWCKNLLIRSFLRCYPVDLAEAAEPDFRAYGNFNEFFTRALKPGARTVAPAPDAVASPCDGTVSACGALDGDRLLQAKGRRYSLRELLADRAGSARFEHGSFVTIYLAPRDYHRIHMPLDGRLAESVFVRGRLFSVNAATTRHVPRLFARNERLAALFECAAGSFALVMVGALNVASLETVWTGPIAPVGRRGVIRLPDAAIALHKGEECGRFNLGSTVILLFEPGRVALAPQIVPGARVRMGQAIGRLVR